MEEIKYSTIKKEIMAKKLSIQSSAKGCSLDKNTALQVSSGIFAVVALLHLWRIATSTPAIFGATIVPMWASWIAVAVAAGLSWWTCKASRQ